MSQSKNDDASNTSQSGNQPASNPFRSGSSRFGRSSGSGPSSSGSSSPGSNPPRPPSRFGGGLGSRFGSSNVEFEIQPVSDVFVRFDLNGLGDPFHRIMGAELNLAHSDPKHIIETIQAGSDLINSLVEQLEATWNSYTLTGAAIMYEWQDDIRRVIGIKPPITKPAADNNDFQDDDDEPTKVEPVKETRIPPTCLRAIDHALVINVLSRTRSGILLAGASMSLEAGFLDRSLITDDSRLVALARATGCLEEQILV